MTYFAFEKETGELAGAGRDPYAAMQNAFEINIEIGRETGELEVFALYIGEKSKMVKVTFTG